jgi:hypothetical protein
MDDAPPAADLDPTKAAPKAAASPAGTARALRRGVARGSAFVPGLLVGALLCQWIPSADQRPTWWTVLSAIATAQLVAHLTWVRRGAVFGVGGATWAWMAAGGAAVGAWGLLLFEPLQRALHARLIAWTLGSPWEGLAEGLVWTAMVGGALALALAGWLAWRKVAHDVLDGRLPARVPHDLMWTAGLLGLLALALAALAPLGLGRLGTLEGPRWIIAAQALSVVVDELGVPLLVLWGTHAAMQLVAGLAWAERERAPAPAAPLLVLLDLDEPPRPDDARLVALHRLGIAWAGLGGDAVVVRPAARAQHGGGTHSRWCAAADRLDALVVDSPATARRWASAWLGRATGLPVLEAWVRAPDALAPLAAAMAAARPGATFLLLAGPGLAGAARLWPGTADLEALRRALPQRSCWALVPPDPAAGSAALPRLATLAGRMDSMRNVKALARQVADLLEHPPPRQRTAVLARPTFDAWCDRLVPWLDQRRHPTGRWIDALRPALDDRVPFDHAIVAIDARWLAIEPRVQGELAALAPVLSGARSVSVVTLGDIDPSPSDEAIFRGLAAAGWNGAFAMIGPAPIDARADTLAALADALVTGNAPPPAAAVATPPRRQIGLLCRPTERTAYAIGPIVEALQRLPGVTVLRPDPALPPGDARWREVTEQLLRCELVIAVVDPDWSRLIQDVEVKSDVPVWTASAAGTPEASALAELLRASDADAGPIVVPLLLDRQPMPSASELPAALSTLAYRNAIQLDPVNEGPRAFDRFVRQIAEAQAARDARAAATPRVAK